MPVITLRKDRLQALVGGNLGFKELVDRLPHLGLHIEEVSEDSVKVEYDPNRLDYSTDYGIARSLRGSFGLAKGVPRHRLLKSDVIFSVDISVKKVRPCIAGLLAKGVELDDETIRQIISMQEDLHNGLGRKRAKLAIGIHDADAVKAPLKYSTVRSSFRFTPLDSKVPLTIGEILSELPTGRKYASLVSAHEIYPIIIDAKKTVLSFPPVINGNTTKVTPQTKNLLIDVTGTDRRVLEDCLALLAEVFWDAGAQVFSVGVRDGGRMSVHAFPRTLLLCRDQPAHLQQAGSQAQGLGDRERAQEVQVGRRRQRREDSRDGSPLQVRSSPLGGPGRGSDVRIRIREAAAVLRFQVHEGLPVLLERISWRPSGGPPSDWASKK